jgi:hypothetical protein
MARRPRVHFPGALFPQRDKDLAQRVGGMELALRKKGERKYFITTA